MQPRNIVAVYFSDRYFLHIPYSQGDKSLGRTSRCQAGHGMTWNDQALWSWARSNMGRLQRPLTCRSHPWPNLSAHAGKPRVSNPHGIVIVIFNVVEFPYGTSKMTSIHISAMDLWRSSAFLVGKSPADPWTSEIWYQLHPTGTANWQVKEPCLSVYSIQLESSWNERCVVLIGVERECRAYVF